MEIKTNLQDCNKCGVYLNIETIRKTILTLKFKEEWVYIRGFICPICKTYHFLMPHNSYIIGSIAREDKEFKQDEYFSIEKYICFKLDIEYKYGENIKQYGEDFCDGRS